MLNPRESSISIPARLSAAVDESLRQVTRLRRRRIERRIGTTFGGLAVAVGAVALLGVANPALAAKLPVIGGLFQTVNTDAKTYGGQHLDDIPQALEMGETAASAHSEGTLTLQRAYSDGYDIQMAFTVEAPESWKAYDGVSVSNGRRCEATVNGVAIQPPNSLSMNGFTDVDGVPTATLRLVLPEELEGQESYDVAVTVKGIQGWKAKPEGGSEPTDLPDEFQIHTKVAADLAHEIRFTSDAEDNGAKVLAVSATPSRTVVTVEQPYWGERPGDSGVYSYSAGYPRLYTEDGEELSMDHLFTHDKGGYDFEAKDAQTAALYFDGAPAGETRLVLKFWEGFDDGDVLAQFTIDLAGRTVTPGGEE